MKRRLIILFVPVSLLLATALVAGVVLRGWPGAGGSSAEFPDFVYHSPEAERGYRLAVQHPRLFAQVACYCGCGVFPDERHRNLLDCFVNDDGTFESHAAGCFVCVSIAGDAGSWQAQGKSVGEVASLVDEKYQKFGPPTRP